MLYMLYAIALSADYCFVPIAIETMGPLGIKATKFLRELGRRLCVTTGDTRETAFLFQRISIAIQRFNAVCFRASFAHHELDIV